LKDSVVVFSQRVTSLKVTTELHSMRVALTTHY